MKVKNIKNFDGLIDLAKKLDDKNIKAVGKYKFKKFHIQISEHKLTGSERVSRLYYRRREAGLCVICAKKVKRINPRTKKLYRLCDEHRMEIDVK